MAQPPSWPPLAILPAPAADLCLDFANTRMWRGTESPQETLHGLDDVIDWCVGRSLLSPERRQRIALAGDAAAAAFAGILDLRETLYRLFSAVAAKAGAAPADLRAFTEALTAAPARSSIAAAPSGYGWSVPPAEPGARELLTPVLWSAADLLVGGRLTRVRQCANSQCLWLFLDDSKSGNRRWCSMSACGNRAKAHRHYLRHKAG